jgi:hypothetical protein
MITKVVLATAYAVLFYATVEMFTDSLGVMFLGGYVALMTWIFIESRIW